MRYHISRFRFRFVRVHVPHNDKDCFITVNNMLPIVKKLRGDKKDIIHLFNDRRKKLFLCLTYDADVCLSGRYY